MRFLKKEEVRQILGCSLRTVNSHIASGQLPVHRLSQRMIRISDDDLADFLACHREGGAGRRAAPGGGNFSPPVECRVDA